MTEYNFRIFVRNFLVPLEAVRIVVQTMLWVPGAGEDEFPHVASYETTGTGDPPEYPYKNYRQKLCRILDYPFDMTVAVYGDSDPTPAATKLAITQEEWDGIAQTGIWRMGIRELFYDAGALNPVYYTTQSLLLPMKLMIEQGQMEVEDRIATIL